MDRYYQQDPTYFYLQDETPEYNYYANSAQDIIPYQNYNFDMDPYTDNMYGNTEYYDTSMGRIPGFLRTQIGKTMKVEFLVGNQLTERMGRLSEVGPGYILLQEFANSTMTMCDLASIKFATILDDDSGGMIIMP